MTAISSAFDTVALGLMSATRRLTTTSKKIAEFGSGTPGSDDLPRNIVDLALEKTSFKADAMVLKTVNQMLGTVLDIFDTHDQ